MNTPDDLNASSLLMLNTLSVLGALVVQVALLLSQAALRELFKSAVSIHTGKHMC